MVRYVACVLLAAGLPGVAGCGRSGDAIRVEGSDTMVNLAQAWAERYRVAHPEVAVQVLGGGSGVGIASLIDGNCDLANASRSIEPKEVERVKAKRGTEPKEFVVGHDALAVYVHKNNPLDEISLEQLAEIYGEGGGVSKWSQLGVDPKVLHGDEITRVSRQNSSGTYTYFREAVLGKGRELQAGVDRPERFQGRGGPDLAHSGRDRLQRQWATPRRRSRCSASASAKASRASPPPWRMQRRRPIRLPRSLLIYSVGEPQGQVKQYLDWILSPDGQKVVLDLGYVPER